MVKTFNTKKSALGKHVIDFDHRIDWNNVKILKSNIHAFKRPVAESFLINQENRSLNVINRNDGANFPAVYNAFTTNKRCCKYFTTLFTCPYYWFCDVIMYSLLPNCLPCWKIIFRV